MTHVILPFPRHSNPDLLLNVDLLPKNDGVHPSKESRYFLNHFFCVPRSHLYELPTVRLEKISSPKSLVVNPW